MTYRDELERLNRLDKARTPGEMWAAAPDDNTGTARWKHYHADTKLFVMSDDCDSHPLADCSCNHTCKWDEDAEANAEYFANAPAMMRLLNDMAAKLERAQSSLKKIGDMPCFCGDLDKCFFCECRKALAFINAPVEGKDD
jgi:hypothetical protein